ncbi:MAG: xanthine dehydrogenase family protein subunit M, partial [Deltaproteobacteria bacterium]
ASPAADLACALLALDAEAVLRSEKRIRVVPLGDFFIGPGQTMINPDELLTEVSIRPPRGKCVFRKLGRRQAMSLSIVNAAVCLEMEGKICRKSRIALGSVAPTPIRCPEAERMLANKEIGPELISKCAKEAMSASKPIDDQRAKGWYRIEAGTVLLRRALTVAAGLNA